MKKNRLLNALSLQQLRDYLRSSQVTRRFAESHDLVYFGMVGRDDESRLVKGLTMSNSQRDSHYLVGTAYGRDIIFLQRSDAIYSATQKKRERYTWNILALDVHHVTLPHLYIEGNGRHGRGFREAFAMKHRELGELPYGFLGGYDPLFAKRFAVRLSAATTALLPEILNPARAAVIAHHFSGFDYELHDDTLYVYFLSAHPTFSQLETMLRAGVWFADELDQAVS